MSYHFKDNAFNACVRIPVIYHTKLYLILADQKYKRNYRSLHRIKIIFPMYVPEGMQISWNTCGYAGRIILKLNLKT